MPDGLASWTQTQHRSLMTEAEFLKWFGTWKDVITFVVAVGAIFVVVVQILQNGRIERNRLRREQVAARASLPLTLAALSEYGTEMLRSLSLLEAWLMQNSIDTPGPEYKGPRLPPETVAAVEKVISAYPDEEVARALAGLLSEVQVLQSRSRDYGASEESIRQWSIAMKDNMVIAAGVIARCDNLFEFARVGADTGQPSRGHLQTILSMNLIHQHRFPRVWKSVERISEEEPPKLVATEGKSLRERFEIGRKNERRTIQTNK